MRKSVASFVSLSLLLFAPGTEVGSAFGQVVAAGPGAGMAVVPVPAGAVAGPIASPAPVGSAAPLSWFSTPAPLADATPAGILGVAPALAVPSIGSSGSQRAAPRPLAVAGAGAPHAPVGVAEISRQVSAALDGVGPVSRAAPDAAWVLGQRLDALLGGYRASAGQASAVEPDEVRRALSLGPVAGIQFAKPAGWDSIAAAVRANPHPLPPPAASWATDFGRGLRSLLGRERRVHALAGAGALILGLAFVPVSPVLGAVLAAAGGWMIRRDLARR